MTSSLVAPVGGRRVRGSRHAIRGLLVVLSTLDSPLVGGTLAEEEVNAYMTQHKGPAGLPTPQRSRLLLVVLGAMIVAGLLQNVTIAIFPSLAIISNVDDMLLILALFISIPRWSSLPGSIFAAISLMLVVVLFAVLRSSVAFGITLELARSVAVPTILVALGLTLLPSEFRKLGIVWIVTSTINATYMAIEFFGVRPIDPVRYTRATGSAGHLFEEYGGLPGSYVYWGADGSVDIRAGGLVMNPPIAGTMVAIGVVVIWHMMSNRSGWKWGLLAVNVFALYAAQGRGGIVIVAVGVLLPWVVKRVGLLIGAGLLLPLAFIGYEVFASAGDSISHVDGLVHGLETSLLRPLGDGFGTAGNAVKVALRNEESSESLIGLALVAGGLLVLLLVVAAFVALTRGMSKAGLRWESYLGLGALVSGLLSESSGALAGASFMWLALGFALLHTRARGKRGPIPTLQSKFRIQKSASAPIMPNAGSNLGR